MCVPPDVRRRKAGFGIIEILISAAVLGFMIVALNMLQTNNRDMILRVRTRDGAVAVAQEVFDSLSTVGVGALQRPADGSKIVLHKSREWTGQPGIYSHRMTVDYTVYLDISDDDDYKDSDEESTTSYTTLYQSSIHRVYAKKVDVEVQWTYKGTPHSVNMSSILR